MKKRVMLWLILVICMAIANPVYARGDGRRGGGGGAGISRGSRTGGSRERKTDRQIERRVGRETDRKAERRDAIREPQSPARERKTDRRIERRTDREGERKEERRDDLRGSDRQREGVTPEESAGLTPTETTRPTAESMREGGKRGEVRELYKENSQQRRDLYKENRPQRHELYDENSAQRKELKTSLDTGGDGKLSKEEIAAGKDAIKSLYDENSAERQGLYQENKGERQELYQENSQQRRDLLRIFDFDGDGQISEEEVTEASAVLDSMAE